jgi:RNA polymerase sigma-70 factor (ECF subfamily)
VLKNIATASDEELVEHALQGAAPAFEELYKRHASMGLRVALGLTGDRELAAEAVQDAFLSMWRKLDRYRPEAGRFRSWAMAIVRHRTIDLVRSRAAGAQQTLLEEELAIADGTPDLAELAGTIDEAERVRRALAELPADQREAVVLGFFGGLSHSEIAAHCGLPLGTVKGRMRIALTKLKGVLGGPAEAGPLFSPQPVATPRWLSTARMNDARSVGDVMVAGSNPA